MIMAMTAVLGLPCEVPCIHVQGAGHPHVNGLYAATTMPDYIGPAAFHKPGTSLWMYRWHQTFWYLSELDTDRLVSERSFTEPVIYTALVGEPRCVRTSPLLILCSSDRAPSSRTQ